MLRVGTILHGTYRIDSYLSSGGFGNTYVATNIEFDERVAIKEFFMKGITQRDDNQTTVSVSNSVNTDSFLEQREKFKKEARRLRKLKNEHIVAVHDLFEENGTAYYVMDYVDGENLAERLKRTGRPMSEQEVREILPQILDALKSVHDAGIWHLDLKPANIMVDKAGKVKLIDFGASKQMNAQKGGATTSTAISYTNGYAPREQMEQNYDKFGPWTDIYALGATLYSLLTNKRPPLPSDIDDDETIDKREALSLPNGVSAEMKSLVLMMLNTNRTKRPQSIAVVMESEKSNKEEPVRDPKQQTTSKYLVNNDEEATIIAKPQFKKEEKKVEPKPESEPEPRATSQTSNTCTSQDSNDSEGSGRGILLGLILAVLFVIIILTNYGGCGNQAQVPDVQNSVPQDTVSETVGETSTVKNGYFEESYDDGSSYKGNFKEGLYHGQGTFTWANGEKYEGEFKEGARIKGTYTWPEKRKGYMYKYVGEFKNNVFEGKGTAYYVGGETESGIWSKGELREQRESNSSSNFDQTINISSTPIASGYIKFQLLSIQLQKNGTILKKSATNTKTNTGWWISSNKSEFIEDVETGVKYYVIKSEIGFKEMDFIVNNSYSKVFKEEYPALPSNVKIVNIYSGSQYYIKNLHVRD